jgi:hypothetical protein
VLRAFLCFEITDFRAVLVRLGSACARNGIDLAGNEHSMQAAPRNKFAVVTCRTGTLHEEAAVWRQRL